VEVLSSIHLFVINQGDSVSLASDLIDPFLNSAVIFRVHLTFINNGIPKVVILYFVEPNN
jgi:hypothetical protein